VEAFFLPAAPGQRFAVLHRPSTGQAVRGGVVYVHPLAEEMNCSRGVVARQARLFAAAGFAVLQLDLHGCGDSSDDFGDATWAGWQADVHLACDTLQKEISAPLCLWGLRAGALLAAQVARQRPDAPALLLWQPLWNGALGLRQLLRLKLAGELMTGGEGGGSKVLRQKLQAGETLEIAGYRLSPALAAALEAAAWPEDMAPRRIAGFELVADAARELSPVATAQLASWRAAGHAAALNSIACPAFWQTPGLDAAPELGVASLAALTEIFA